MGRVASRMQYVEMWSWSDRVRSCSRMRLPSRRVKRRTHPTWSEGSPPSISDSATAGCQAVWLLKSRSTAHTRAMGASMIAERVTRITAGRSAPEHAFERVEAHLEHALADALRQLSFPLGGAIELGPPLGEGAIAVRHRGELEGGYVVLHTHRALQDGVGALEVVVGEGQELFADHPTVLQAEVPDAADLVRGEPAFDVGLRHERRPRREPVEVTDLRPHRVGGRVDHARDVDLDHGVWPRAAGYSSVGPLGDGVWGRALWPPRSRRPRATLPTSPASTPISRRS